MAANTDIRRGPVSIQFFAGGTTNMSYNCLDRWVAAGRGEQAALIWEGNDENERRTVSYRELLAEVNRLVRLSSGLVFLDLEFGC